MHCLLRAKDYHTHTCSQSRRATQETLIYTQLLRSITLSWLLSLSHISRTGRLFLQRFLNICFETDVKTWPWSREHPLLNNKQNRSSQWRQRRLPFRWAFTRHLRYILHTSTFSTRALCVIYTAGWHPGWFGIGLSLNGSMTDSELPCPSWKQWYREGLGRRGIPEALKSNVTYCLSTKIW